jgi:DNA-binding GntR family transcriptional regulator
LLTIFQTFRQDCGVGVSANENYDALRAAIVRGEIAPDARLVEADVSATFGMSRGAVRTALIRLEQDGLVAREPHRGARVRKVSDAEAVEILQARAVLEGLAARPRFRSDRVFSLGAVGGMQRHEEAVYEAGAA